jgi:predicted O-methyltransferase YrrM
LERKTFKARLADALAPVEGWLYLGEAWALHESVRKIASDDIPPAVVEIGSWKGRSTIALALGVRARGAGTVYAIDPHTGIGITTETVTEFRQNVENAGVDSVVELMTTTSHEARSQFAARSIDVLFIDGSHEFEDVKADIADWQTALKDQATIAFNDPSWPGVYRALKEFVLERGNQYRSPMLVQNTLFFEFRRGARWTTQDSIALLRLRLVLKLRFAASRIRPYMPVWFVGIGHAASARMVGRKSWASSDDVVP